MSMIWPIALVVFSNIVYQICAKGVPKEMDAMASMTITYLVGAVCSAIMYFVMNKNGNLLQEYAKMNGGWFYLCLQKRLGSQYGVPCAKCIFGSCIDYCGSSFVPRSNHSQQSHWDRNMFDWSLFYK